VPACGRLDAPAFLSVVADSAAGIPSDLIVPESIDPSALALWLRHARLSAATYALARRSGGELARRLRVDALAAAAANLVRFRALRSIEADFASGAVPVVLLKGAAVAEAAYGDVAWRPMSDLDLWVRDEDVPHAAARLERLGYTRLPELPDRPEALQRRSGGEVVFAGPRGTGLLELHYSAFQGWWIRRTGRPDAAGVWERSIPAGPGRHARRLAPEDAILQTAFHVTVNQFGQAPLRGLLDLAVMARRFEIDWDAVVSRARAWRLATATGLVLAAADALFGLGPGGPAARSLAPRGVRRALLRRFVTLESILKGRDLTRSPARHAFLLALVDRPRDAARLVGRTLWPEAWWRAARYGRPVGPLEHVWSMARRGGV
jgi:hypothetical protein